MPTFESMQRGYGNLWRRATIKPGADDAAATKFADKIIAAEERYRAVQAATGVPWFFIGALHMRESSCDFTGVLHNGEKIIGTGRLTSLVPPNRGPFATWEEAASDALKLKNLHRVQEWTIERMLYHAEEFNGWGYVGKGVNSAYVWAGTTLEQPGKYVADHVWNASFDDPQIGVACVLKRLAEKRPDISAALETDDASGAVVPAQPVEVLPPQSDVGAVVRQLLPIIAPVAWAAVREKVAPDQRAAIDGLMQALFGTAVPVSPVAPPSIVVTPAPAPTAPAASTDKKTLGVSLIGLVLSALGMATGVIGTPLDMGMTPTPAGTASIVVPLVTAIAGATGLASPAVGFGLRFLSAFATAFANRPKQ